MHTTQVWSICWVLCVCSYINTTVFKWVIPFCYFGSNKKLINLIKHTSGNTFLCQLSNKVKQLSIDGGQVHLVFGLILQICVASSDPLKFKEEAGAYIINDKNCTFIMFSGFLNGTSTALYNGRSYTNRWNKSLSCPLRKSSVQCLCPKTLTCGQLFSPTIWQPLDHLSHRRQQIIPRKSLIEWFSWNNSFLVSIPFDYNDVLLYF